MKKLLFTTIAAGFLAVSASAADCDQISDYAGLKAFASKVNNGDKTACAVVTAKIVDNTSLLKSNGDVQKKNPSEWTPIEGFQGTFDGGDYEISGLYKKGSVGAGLFSSVEGNAVIKNVKLVDSYFRVDDYASGLVATVAGGNVTIDNCSFAGTVAGGTDGGTAENIGGLVGVVKDGAKLTLTNSHNDGQVFASTQKCTGGNIIASTYSCSESMKSGDYIGGLIGKVENGASVNVDNCYNTGKVDANGGSNQSAIASAQDGAELTLENVYCVKSGKNTGSCPAELEKSPSEINTLFTANKEVQAQAAALADLGLKGVTIKSEDGKLVATLNSTADELYIPEDIEVAKVVLDRKFNAGVTSTVMLPFTIEAYKLNAELLYIKSVDATGADAETETETVQAYTPYFVGEGVTSITVDGAVTLKKTTGSEEVSSDIGNWSFKARLTSKIWDAADGKSYTYSPIEVKNSEGETSVEKGTFAKIGKNVRVRPMRAYLYYNGSAATPFAAKARAGATLMNSNVIALEDLPASIPVRFTHKDIIVPEIPVEEDNEIASIEGDEEEAMSIAKPVMTPSAVKSNRWYDLKGRRMNSKPTAHGTYFNNKTPVVVK
ncbi:MAG: hypothetical protein MJY85_06965 [Fibrobacter sp.]|nr:hypothetical protein [Fibrobacter sp.]